MTKQLLLNRVRKYSNLKFVYLLLVAIMACAPTFSYAEGQEILNRRISINSQQEKIHSVLKNINRQANVRFTYSSSLIDPQTKVSVHAQNQPLSDILRQIFTEDSNISYKIEGDQVILFQAKDSKSAGQTLEVKQINAERKVSGVVSDNKGEVLPGVSIVVKGTQNGTITNATGEFNLNVPDNGAVLVLSFVGFQTQEVVIGNQQIINVTLETSSQNLSEVVVVGYGAVSKKEVTGSVATISGNEISSMPVRSASDALQGKVPGVMVSQSSGSPGSMGVVRIRGIGSINNSNEPLYIVDGLPQTGIGWLNPSDIETMDVHKDASAAAIYGSRASNGLIMITTKKGSKNDAISVSFDGYYGFQSAAKRPHMLNAEEFIDYKNRAAAAVGAPLPISESMKTEALAFVRANTGANGTDWWKQITNENAPVQNYNVSVAGGSRKVDFASSLGYMDQQGIIKGSDYNRISWRNNVNANLSERVKLGTNLGIIYESRRNINENNPYSGTIFSAMTADPITPVFRNNLTNIPSFYSTIMNGYDASNPFSRHAGILYSNKPNPVAQTERMSQSIWEGISLKGGANLEVKILEPLKFRSNLGMDLHRGISKGFTPQYFLNGYDYSNFSNVSNSSSWSDYFVWENTLTYDEYFGNHHLTVLAGVSAEKTKGLAYAASKQGTVNNDEDMRIIDAGTINPGASGYTYSSALSSYFGRVSYSYDGRYVVTANLRRDGTSSFANGYRWGTFPSVSAAWNFTNEEFISNLNLPWLSEGKLRVSYGQIGNQNVPGGAYLSNYGNTGRYLFGNNTTAYLGAGRISIGNPVLQWETSTQTDIGLDLSFFDKKLTFHADYFNKVVDNMLLVVPLPSTLGFPNSPWSNAGKMENKGIELALGYSNNIGDFEYGIQGNVSTFKNKVLTLGGGEPIHATAHLGQTITKTEEGMPVGYYYGWLTDGIFQTQAEVDAHPQKGLSTPGDIRFVNINGDQLLNADDRTIIGNPWPDFVYGLTLNAAWKGFDVSAFIQGSQGNDVMNILRYDTEAGTGWYNAPKGFLENAWNGAGSTNEYYKISQNAGLNTNISNYFVEDGSYMRMKNLQVGYTLPASLLSKARIKSIRVYAAAQNLFTITGYSGLDPEMGAADPKLTGIDQGYFPQARTFMFGINAKF